MEGDNAGNQNVNFSGPRPLKKRVNSKFIETFYPDNPFKGFKDESPKRRLIRGLQYFVPIFEWFPTYTAQTFWFDLLAGLTIASLAIPQGISYANLAKIPPIIGLYSSFVPPFIYTMFGSSRNMAVGTVAAASLLIAETIGTVVEPNPNDPLYLKLVFTATFIAGVFQLTLGVLRLGILVDFLSHSTILGFMNGTAIIIGLQQFKGLLGMKHFTKHTDVFSVIGALIKYRAEWRWQCAVIGISILILLQLSKYLRTKKPHLFWVSAMAPLVAVLLGCIIVFITKADKNYGFQIVGPLKKGLNPPSIKLLTFDRKLIAAPLRAGIITGILALAEGIAIGRSFAIKKNEQIDGNKEMIAFGLMNIVGSFTSCYLTTGPFSKTAVNYNAGCKTQMANVVQALLLLLTLLVLAPFFSNTPMVALSAIIMSAMIGLFDYEKIIHLYKVDKFDFCICMTSFIGVAFVSMDVGLGLSVLLGVIRALLASARPATCKLGKIPQTNLYRDVEQYPIATATPGILVLKLGSPIFFSNSTYIRERVQRWVRDEATNNNEVEHLILELGGVTTIDMTGLEALFELKRLVEVKGVKISLVNPRLEVMEKLISAEFIDAIGKGNVYLSVDEAVDSCRFRLTGPKSTAVGTA